MDTRIRDIQRSVARLCPPDAARNVRVGPLEHRMHYVVARVSGADALDLVRLLSKYPDYGFYLRDVDDKTYLDVYIPVGSNPAVSVLRAGSKGALVAGVVAILLALWTVFSQ